MTLNEIIEFLTSKPGYAKEGAKRLANKTFKGKASIADCSKALFLTRTKLGIIKDKEKLKTLIFDIETSYNIVSTWRAGYKINIPHYSIIKERAIICVSYKWLGEKEVYSISWDNNQDDKFLLEQFIEVMNEADVLVAHNANKFDIKWVKTRALKHGLEMLPTYSTVDTLSLAKKHFLFNSNKLDYISKFLGHEGKLNTESGLWDDVILKNDNTALNKMIDYCEEDVRQLEKVYNHLKQFDKPQQHAGALYEDNKQSSPISGSINLELVKITTTPAGTKKCIMRDLSTNRLFEMSHNNYKKWKETNNK